MEEWKEYKLRDFLLIPIRNGLTKPSAIRGQGVKMIGMKEIFAMDYIRPVEMDRVPVTNKEYESSEIMKYDLLFARQSLTLEGAGKCSIVVSVDEPTVFESHLIRLRIDTKKANPFFIYYYYKSSIGKNQIKSLVQQVAAAGIRGKELIELGIKVPHIEKQNQIASILKSLDDKIEVNRKINENLEQQAQALFKSWFVDFEPFKNGEFVESELGMIPKGWRVGTLGNLLEIKYGKDHKKLADGKVPVYGSGGLMRRVDKTLYIGESVLIPRKGTLNNVMYVNEGFWTVDTMFYTIPKIEHIALFCYLLLSGKDLASMNAGSAVPSMTTEILNSMPVVIPQKNIVNEFDSVVSSFFRKIESNNQEFRRLAELRDTLLPKLMLGELKVNEIIA